MIAASSDFARTAFGTLGTLIFAGLCLAGATAPAYAFELGRSARSEVVRTGDLNLASNAGRETLADRIEAAADRVCVTGTSDVAGRLEQSRCRRNAVAAASTRVVDSAARSN